MDYLKSQSVSVIPPRESIAKYIKRLFNEREIKAKYGDICYEEWHISNSDIRIDKENKCFNRFSLNVKKALCKEIIDIIMNNRNKISKSKILEKLKFEIDNQDLEKNQSDHDSKILRY